MLDLLLFLGISVISRFIPWLYYKDCSSRFGHSGWCNLKLDLLLFLGIPVISRFYPWLHYKDCLSRFGHSGWCNYNAKSALISRYPSYIKILHLVTLKIVLVGLVILDGVTIMLDLLLFLGIPVISRFYTWLYYKDCSSRFGHSGGYSYNAGSALISRYPSYIKILHLVIL